MPTVLRPRSICAIALIATFAPLSAVAHDEGIATSFGQPGRSRDVQRTITIRMSDAMRFDPSSIRVAKGQTVRLHIVNDGKLAHEFVLGTAADIDAHAAMMKRHPGMVHADASAVTLAPGKSGDLLWKFGTAGQFTYACLIAGHLEAGMQGRVTVTAAAKQE